MIEVRCAPKTDITLQSYTLPLRTNLSDENNPSSIGYPLTGSLSQLKQALWTDLGILLVQRNNVQTLQFLRAEVMKHSHRCWPTPCQCHEEKLK